MILGKLFLYVLFAFSVGIHAAPDPRECEHYLVLSTEQFRYDGKVDYPNKAEEQKLIAELLDGLMRHGPLSAVVAGIQPAAKVDPCNTDGICHPWDLTSVKRLQNAVSYGAISAPELKWIVVPVHQIRGGVNVGSHNVYVLNRAAIRKRIERTDIQEELRQLRVWNNELSRFVLRGSEPGEVSYNEVFTEALYVATFWSRPLVSEGDGEDSVGMHNARILARVLMERTDWLRGRRRLRGTVRPEVQKYIWWHDHYRRDPRHKAYTPQEIISSWDDLPAPRFEPDRG